MVLTWRDDYLNTYQFAAVTCETTLGPLIHKYQKPRRVSGHWTLPFHISRWPLRFQCFPLREHSSNKPGIFIASQQLVLLERPSVPASMTNYSTIDVKTVG